ncbi:MAG: HU family DNA-binding protein [Bacteroidales bacterium]|nr:HU family DNA-binding protein [Bacteroidales bacterium]
MAKKRYWTYEAKKKKVLKQDKWVATLRRQDHLTLEETSEMVSIRGTILPSEVSGVLRAYFEQIRYHVLAGDSVNVKGLGTFYPKMTTKMVDSVEDATISNCVKNITIGFRPSNELKEVINKSGFRAFAPANNASPKEDK